MSSAGKDAKKRCKNCLEYVKIYITCFKCDAAYHIYCWKKVPGAYVNERGQLFCCSSLTSNYATTKPNLGTQDNPPEGVIKKGKVDDHKKDLENHTIKQEDVEWNEFKCDACHLEFTNKEYLENHCRKCPSKEGEFIQAIKEDEDLENCLHKEEDLEWSEFRCGACLLALTNKEHLINHYSECPNKEGEFIRELKENKDGLCCSFCNEEHHQKESYEQHIRPCHVENSCSRLNEDNSTCITNTKRNRTRVDGKEENYKCTVCNYSTHIKECVVKCICIHSNERSFKCDMRDYTVKESETLQSHFSLKHYDRKEEDDFSIPTFSTPLEDAFGSHQQIYISERPFKCDWCDYIAAQEMNLKIHIKSKHSNATKEYKCKDCKYSAHTKAKLVSHVRTHTNEQPFKCDVCDYAAAQRGTLNVHILAKHSNAAKKYKCKDCKYSTHTKAALVRHIRTHTNEKPFKCDMCDYAAAHKCNLKYHILMKHSNAGQEYKCKHCKYSSYNKTNLVSHIRTHTKEKPFKCDMCDYAAAVKSSLKYHILMKHSNAE